MNPRQSIYTATVVLSATVDKLARLNPATMSAKEMSEQLHEARAEIRQQVAYIRKTLEVK